MISISVAEGADYVDDLAQWLGQYPELSGKITSPSADGQTGIMAGSLVDALVVAVGAGGSLTVLAKGIVAWAGSYRLQRGVDVHVYAINRDGEKIAVDVRNAPSAESVLSQILEKVDRGES